MPGPLLSPRPGRMVAVTALWGACFVAIRWGLPYSPILWFAALRTLLAGAVLVTAGTALHRPAPPRRSWPAVAVLGTVNVALAFAAMFAGTVGVASGVAAVLANSQPLLIVLPAWWLYGERPHRRATLGLGMGFLGLVVVAVPGGAGRGALLSLGAAAAVTVGTLLARRLLALDPLMVAGWQFVVGGVVLSVWAFVSEGPPAIRWTWAFTASLSFLALFGTAAAYLIWFVELRRSSVVALSAWTLLTPVFGIVFGMVLLGDRLSRLQGVGVTLVLLALPAILVPPRGKRLASQLPGLPATPASQERVG